MREVSPQIARYAVLSVLIALFLGACVQPVALGPFLNDPYVKGISDGDKEPGVTIQLHFEMDGVIEPILTGGDTPGTVTNPIVLSSSSPSVIITVSTSPASDTSFIEWYCGDDIVQPGALNLSSYTVSIDNSPFDTAGVYQLSVLGIIGTAPDVTLYHGDVYIKVVQ